MAPRVQPTGIGDVLGVLVRESALAVPGSCCAVALRIHPHPFDPLFNMQFLSNSASRASLLALVPILWATPGLAQDTPAFWVSTSSDLGNLSADQPEFSDASLARVASGEAARPVCFDGHWEALGGTLPTDVDALAQRPLLGPVPGSGLASMCFSLQSNQGGMLDGDVLELAAGGGFQVWLSEGELAAELGVPDAAIDVDALAFDLAGRLVFSLQNNLDDTVLGSVADGDVLVRDGMGGIQRLASESDVQAAYTTVTGSTSAIGDVLAAHVDAAGLWVAVQSPSSADGGMLLVGPAPQWIDESTLDLGGAELSAMTAAPVDAGPVGWVVPQADGSYRGRIEGANPGAVLAVLAAGQPGFQALPGQPGFGAFYVDGLDPHLSGVLSGAGPSLVLSDGNGSVDATFNLPSVGSAAGWAGGAGWTFQVVEFGSGRIGAPFRLTL